MAQRRGAPALHLPSHHLNCYLKVTPGGLGTWLLRAGFGMHGWFLTGIGKAAVLLVASCRQLRDTRASEKVAQPSSIFPSHPLCTGADAPLWRWFCTGLCPGGTMALGTICWL